MYQANAPWRPLATAALRWGEDGAPRSAEHGDIYHSPEDGAAESRHVFLAGNRLRERWSAAAGSFRIGELGFGTGLNFLLTLEDFLAVAPASLRLHYWAVEHAPLRRQDMDRCLRRQPVPGAPAAALLADYPPPVPGTHRLVFGDGRVTLDLCWGDAAAALEDLTGHGRAWFDAWYLDGFAPARNPSLWDDALWPSLARLSRAGATVSTFSAAGAVRRGLAAAGFVLHKRPGYGRKRESLAGHLAAPRQPAAPPDTPWDRDVAPAPAPASALVLGAGLAGASAAAALARRGVRVTVLDSGPVAGRASGNTAGVLYARFSHRHAPVTDCALLGALDARRRYRALFERGLLAAGRDGELAGAFQMAGPRVRLAQLRPAIGAIPELVELLAADAAAQRLGTRPAAAGLWLPHAGWLHPPAVCHALLSHPRIDVVSDTGPLRLRAAGGGWEARGETPGRWHADIAVVAAGIGSGRLAGLDWLPLRPIRGQVTELPARQLPSALRAPFCHDGYATPARDGRIAAGATFVPGDDSTALRAAEHRENLAALAAALPAWATALGGLPPAALDGRAELRTGSPDYLPLAGPVPDPGAFETRFAALAGNARRPIASAGVYRRGLFVSTGHGSRGLTSAPLAGELIASRACDEPPPLPRALVRALAPARFIVRAVARRGTAR